MALEFLTPEEVQAIREQHPRLCDGATDEEIERTTAGWFQRHHKPCRDPVVLAALDEAVKAFSVEETDDERRATH